jgi:hypothetical protein
LCHCASAKSDFFFIGLSYGKQFVAGQSNTANETRAYALQVISECLVPATEVFADLKEKFCQWISHKRVYE